MPDRRVLQRSHRSLHLSGQKGALFLLRAFLNGNMSEMRKFPGIYITLKMKCYRLQVSMMTGLKTIPVRSSVHSQLLLLMQMILWPGYIIPARECPSYSINLLNPDGLIFLHHRLMHFPY